MTYSDQRNYREASVTTRLWTSLSDTCMLTVSAWNTQFSLTLRPYVSTNSNGMREYSKDKNEFIKTALQVDNTKVFAKSIREVLLPAIDKNEEASVSVITGVGANMKIIELKHADGKVTLNLYNNVDNETKVGKLAITHLFPTRTYLKGYNNETGASEEEVVVQSDLLQFLNRLENTSNFDASVAHSLAYAAEDRSVFVVGKNGYGNSGGNNSSFAGGYDNNNQQVYQASQSTETGLDFLPSY